jgi:hypothetical protein
LQSLADFTINKNAVTGGEKVCSSNNENSDCFLNSATPGTMSSNNLDYFEIGSGLCSQGILDVYFEAGGWDVYYISTGVSDLIDIPATIRALLDAYCAGASGICMVNVKCERTTVFWNFVSWH